MALSDLPAAGLATNSPIRLQRRRPSLAWLAPAVFFQFFCSLGPSAFLQDDLKRRHGTQAVILWTWTMGLRGAFSFFLSPGIGALTDHWGRNPIFALQVLMAAMPALPLAIMSDVAWSVDLALGLMLLSGLSGSQFTIPFAYCADLAPRGEANKVQALIARMLAASFAPSFIIGPPVWKYLFEYLGSATCWALVAGISVVNCLYVWLLLPESRKFSAHSLTADASPKTPSNNTGPPQLSRNPFRYFRLFTASGPAGPEAARLLRLISSIVFFLYAAKVNFIFCVVLFAEQRFGWSPGNAGMLLSMWGCFQFLSMAVVGIVGKRVDERIVSWVGLVSAFLGLLILFFVVRGWMLFLGMAVGAISMISLTALTSYAGCLVRTSMHGEVQGLITTMVALSEVFGPPVFGSLLATTLQDPDAPWWIVNLPFGIGVLCVLVAMMLMTRLPHISKAMSLCGRNLDQSVLLEQSS